MKIIKVEPFCQIFFQNGFSSTREADPPEELEPELFLKEPEPRQTCHLKSYTRFFFPPFLREDLIFPFSK